MKKRIIQFVVSISTIALIVFLVEGGRRLNDLTPNLELSQFWLFFWIIYGLSVLFTSFLLILEHNRPTKTLAWLLVIIFLPVIGLILYLFFGFNYRKEKLFDRKVLQLPANGSGGVLRRTQLNHLIEQHPELFKRQQATGLLENTIRLLCNNSETEVSARNQVRILAGGRETLDSLVADISQARDHIHLEYYILKDGAFGDAIREKLIEKAGAGVTVRVLYDDVGSWSLSRKFRRSIRQAGGSIEPFMPVHFPLLTSRFNYRNHRKIAVIDGRIGYTGGINIDDNYLQEEPHKWRDTHLRIEGPAVYPLQRTFLQDWHFATEEAIEERNYFPENEQAPGQTLMQIVASGPDTDYPSIMHAYFNAICMARERVWITTPYFIPNESMLTALKTAALSGVDVRLLIPRKSDNLIATLTARSYLEDIMEAGVRVFYYSRGVIHCKILIVDDVFASVGTANMDIRSFEINFEVNAVLYDPVLNRRLREHYEEDLKCSHQLEPNEFRERPLFRRLVEGTARLLAPML